MAGNNDSMETRVAVVTFPVGLLSSVFSMQESLVAANYCSYPFGAPRGTFKVDLVGQSTQGVQSYSGARVQCVGPLPDPTEVDLVVVPAGPPPVIDQPSLQAWLTANEQTRDWLVETHKGGAQIASTCTGSLLLAHAGLLDGLPATTHWVIEQVAQQQFPHVLWRADETMIEHENVITAGGGYIYPALLQHLIRQYLGNEVAVETSRMLLMDAHNERQAVYRQGALDVKYPNPRIEALKHFVASNFRKAMSLADMAAAVSLSERTLIRTCQKELGMTPMQFVQRVRVESVMNALQVTAEPVNQIVWDTGYEDVSSFQRLFKRHTGLTMSEYRRRFGVKIYNHEEQLNGAFQA